MKQSSTNSFNSTLALIGNICLHGREFKCSIPLNDERELDWTCTYPKEFKRKSIVASVTVTLKPDIDHW
jgi:hypothetical protein